MAGSKAVDILSAVGDTRFLRTYPEQIRIIYVDTLDTDLVDLPRVRIDIAWHHTLHRMRVNIHFQQSELVAANPDVARAVAGHTVDVPVYTVARQPERRTDIRVPRGGTLIIHIQCSLSVEPDVVHLVGEGTQRFRTTILQLWQSLCGPDCMLLVHHIATYEFSVIIHDDGSVSALTDRTDHTLRNSLCVVGIAELIEQLLLLVVAHDTLVGNRAPEVLMTVDIDDAGDGLDTHACKRLLHVALEGLRLRVIDAVA